MVATVMFVGMNGLRGAKEKFRCDVLSASRLIGTGRKMSAPSRAELAICPVLPLAVSRKAPSWKRGVKIAAPIEMWTWLVEQSLTSPGIVFQALTDGWLITSEMVDGDLEFRSHRLR